MNLLVFYMIYNIAIEILYSDFVLFVLQKLSFIYKN